MANSYDDDITLKIGMNTDDVVSKSEELQKSIQHALEIGDNNRLTKGLRNILKQLQTYDGEITNIIERMEQLKSQKIADNPKWIALSNELTALQRKAEQLETIKLDNLSPNKVFTFQYRQLTDDLTEAQTKATELESRLKQLTTQNNQHSTSKLRNDIKRYTKNLETTGNRIDWLKSKIAELKSSDKEFTPEYKEYEDVLQQISELEGKMRKTSGVIPVTEGTQYQQLVGDLEGVINNVRELQSKLGGLADEGVANAQKLSDAFANVSNEVRTQTQIIMNPIELLKIAFRELPGVIGRVTVALVKLPFNIVRQGLTSVASGAKNVAANLGKIVASGIEHGLKRIASAAKNAASNLVKMVTTKIKNGLSSLAKSMSHLGKSSNATNFSLKKGIRMFIRYGLGMRSLFALINKLRRALIDGLGQMSEAYAPFGNVVTNFKNSVELLKGSFASLAAPILQQALPAITTFINKLSEGITMLGKFIVALQGKSMFVQATSAVTDTAKNATKALKNTAKAAKEAQRELFGFDQINRFSKQDTDDYDSGSGDTGSDSSSPNITFEEVPIESMFAEWADKLKEMWEKADFTELGTIIGTKLRDALNKIPWDIIKQVCAKIGKSIATLLNGFLQVPGLFDAIGKTIAQGLNSAFEFAYAFVTNFRWDSFGKAVRDLLNGAFTRIDWTLIYKTLGKVGTGVGTTLENAFDNPAIWNNIFGAIARGFNSVVFGLYNFITSIDWVSTAQNIAYGLNNGVNLIDWSMVTSTLVLAIDNLFDTLYYFFTTLDFKDWGTHLGTTVSGVLKGVDWEKGGASVSAVIDSLLSALDGFVSTTDWESLGEAVVNFIGGFFNKFDWETLGHLLSHLAMGLLITLLSMWQKIDWDKLPQHVVDTIGKFFAGFDWEDLIDLTLALLASMFKIKTRLDGAFGQLIIDIGKSIWDGLSKGIVYLVSNPAKAAEWVWNNVFIPLGKAIKDAFGISSPAKEMEPYGGYIADGLLEGIKNVFADPLDWIKKYIFEPFKTGLETAFNIVNGTANGLLEIGESIVEGIKGGIDTAITGLEKAGSWFSTHVFTPVKSGIETAFGWGAGAAGNLVELGKGIVKDLTSGVDKQEKSDGIAAAVKAHAEEAKAEAKNTDWQGAGSEIPKGLNRGIELSWAVLKVMFKLMWTTLKIETQNAGWSDLGTNITSKLNSGILTGLKIIETTYKTTWENIKTNTTNITWNLLGTTITNSLKTGISTGLTLIKTLYSTIFNSIKKDTENIAWKNLGTTITNDLKTTINTGLESIKALFNTAWNNIRTNAQNFNWNDIGANIVLTISRGMYNNSYELYNTASDLSTSIENAFDRDWSYIGLNICYGIERGMYNGWQNVTITAWNLAVDAYNWAMAALGIASPSKVFRDKVGAMIPAGMALGIQDETSTVLDAMNKLSNAVINNGDIQLPDIVGGKVIPYSAGKSSDKDDVTDTLNRVADMLEYNQSDNITRGDLESILTTLLQKYLKIDFYIGDEQIARHANAGNEKIDRRFNPSIA